MAWRIWCLMVYGGLILSPVLADEVKPSALDWQALTSQAKQTRDEYARQADLLRQQITQIKSSTMAVGGSESRAQTAKDLEAKLTALQPALMQMNQIYDTLAKMTDDERTRARFLDLRKKERKYAFQAMQDFGYRRYGNDDPVAMLEARVDWEAKHPSQSIPIAPALKGLHFTWQDFPRIDGSSTAQPLAALIASRALGLGAIWQTRQIYDPRNSEGTAECILVPMCSEPPMYLPQTDYANRTPAMGLHVNVELSGSTGMA